MAQSLEGFAQGAYHRATSLVSDFSTIGTIELFDVFQAVGLGSRMLL